MSTAAKPVVPEVGASPKAGGLGASGVLPAVMAYSLWGLFVVYFKSVSHVAPMEILAHRIVWAVPFCLLLLFLTGRMANFTALIRSRAAWRALMVSAALVSVNWLSFIWAVANDQVLQASLGYFIVPLMSIVLGLVFMGERLRRAQWAAVALAAVGVAYLTLREGTPVVALIVAGTFALYGFVRKRAHPGPLAGLMFETSLLMPFALGYLVFLHIAGRPLSFTDDGLGTTGLLLAAGPITCIPLLLFAIGSKKLTLSTMAFLQFISPTIQFAMGLLYGEAFSVAKGISFALIWAGVGVFVWDAVRRRGR